MALATRTMAAETERAWQRSEYRGGTAAANYLSMELEIGQIREGRRGMVEAGLVLCFHSVRNG